MTDQPINIKTTVEDSPRSFQLVIVNSIWRKRRDSESSIRHDTGTVIIAIAPERRQVGQSGRADYQTPRARKLTPEQEAELVQLAKTYSLRELADRFGVSHETARKVIRERGGLLTLPNPRNGATDGKNPRNSGRNAVAAPMQPVEGVAQRRNGSESTKVA